MGTHPGLANGVDRPEIVSVSDLIGRYTVRNFADDLGVTYGAAKQMRRRGSIPSAHWAMLLEAARTRGLTWITADFLIKLHDRRANERSLPETICNEETSVSANRDAEICGGAA